MEYFLIFALLFFLFGFVRIPRRKAEGQETVPVLPSEQNLYELKTEDGREYLDHNGARYWEYRGEWDEVAGLQVWDWHGRMGDGVGYLTRKGELLTVGELYRLRGGGDILLAFLPGDGWPITDMKLFLREGETLPELRADGFSLAEVYRVTGEFPEEEYEKVREISDSVWISAFARVWLSGESVSLPEGEYDRYRVRLYSSEMPGLYVLVTVHVNQLYQCFGVEQYRFSGDALLAPEAGALLLE